MIINGQRYEAEPAVEAYVKELETEKNSLNEQVKRLEEVQTMTERQKRICHKICEHYGVERQRRQLIEELGELITAICKYERSMYINDTDAVKQVVDRHKDVLTEIADVEIMLEQVKERYFHEDDIAAEIDRKLERQLKRMGEGDEE